MTSLFKNLLLIVTLFLFSCGHEEKKEKPKEKWEIRDEKQKKLDTLNTNEVQNLSKQLNAITDKDSTIKFTYQIQEVVKKNIPISFSGFISDITKKDSNYILKIYGVFVKQRSFAEVLVSPEQFRQLNKQLDPKLLYNRGTFIFKPTSIKTSSMLTIDSEVSTDDYAETVDDANANASSELTYDFHRVLLFFKGSLINFYLNKRLEKDDD